MAVDASSSAARVFIVDDHPIFRSGLAALINAQPNLRCIGEAGSAEEALSLLPEADADLVVIDVSLPGDSGLGLLRRIKADKPEQLAIVLSMHDELVYAERALRARADGYISKALAPDQIIRGFERALAGERVVSDRIAERLRGTTTADGVPASPVARLSDRELEVFELTGRGHGTRRAAGMLGISIKTVETHKANVRAKLGLRDAGELLRSAVAWTAELEGTR